MKKFVMFVTALVVVSASAFAATTGDLTLSGSVPGILEITINSEPAASNLDLTVAETDLPVATVVERSNKKAGYTVSLDSSNATGSQAFLAGTGATFETLNYSISYGGTPVTLSSGSAVISDVNTKTSGTGDEKTLTISYDGSAVFLAEDTYSDTLTLTIEAK